MPWCPGVVQQVVTCVANRPKFASKQQDHEKIVNFAQGEKLFLCCAQNPAAGNGANE